MNILLLTAHSIAEYDDLRMLSDIGADVFSIGAYTDPAHPGDDMRPALSIPAHPDLEALCIQQREKHAHESDAATMEVVVDWAKADLHPDIIEWADVIIAHHYLDRWIIPQWSRIKHKRVVWRTCGQSDPWLEERMARLEGLEIVRYSPKERETFEAIGAWAGSTRYIPFGKYPRDWSGWTGEWPVVGNITQKLQERGDHVGYGFWRAATNGLPAVPGGPLSEAIGGVGSMSYREMQRYLRRVRVYLYMGTVPASYTLGLLEAVMTGTPVISIGPRAWAGPSELFQGHEIAGAWSDDPDEAHDMLERALWDDEYVAEIQLRQHRGDRFRMENVAPVWADFLGIPQVESIEVYK